MWKIKKFPGATEQTLRAEVQLVSTTRERKPWARPPISMQFQVGCGGVWGGGSQTGSQTGLGLGLDRRQQRRARHL